MLFSGSWYEFSEQLQGVVAIDGEILRRSFERASGKSALRMVSARGRGTLVAAGSALNGKRQT